MKKKIFVLLILVVFGSIFWKMYVDLDQKKQNAAEQEENENKLAFENKIKNDTDEYLKQAQIFANQEYDKCLTKVSEGRSKIDECFFNAAQQSRDRSWCDKILGEEKKNLCYGVFKYEKIREDNSVNDCGLLPAQLAESCYNDFFLKFNRLSECDPFSGAEKIRCLDFVNSKMALEKRNKNLCSAISNTVIKSDCELQVGSLPLDSDEDGVDDQTEMIYGLDPFNKDTDRDKLSDGEELNKYKTNPLNPDSDNDGFKDGEEVANGFNPNGR